MELRNPYESAHWRTAGGVMRPGGLELTRHLLERARLHDGARVLDLGCGHGAATDFLARRGFQVVGMDPSPAILKDARERYPHLTFVRGDATSIPVADGTFDAVLLECVLSAVPTGEALAECARVTSAQGRLLISDVYSLDSGSGPLSRAWWELRLASGGFRRACFEDRTRSLQDFAAQLLWDTGSLNGLCGCMRCEMPEKPGYFALIAGKGKCNIDH